MPLKRRAHHRAKLFQRLADACRVAAPPGVATAVILALVLVVRGVIRGNEFVSDDPWQSIAVAAGLALVVFFTYFVLALAGFKASAPGVVDAPRIYAWPTVVVMVVVVFGIVFALLLRR